VSADRKHLLCGVCSSIAKNPVIAARAAHFQNVCVLQEYSVKDRQPAFHQPVDERGDIRRMQFNPPNQGAMRQAPRFSRYAASAA